ncbi:hypothetical protein N7456_003400 [Penicillium angulare]|uniref:NADH:flavin oxidoreductase/NADH oxidase N-terminal domain-containing protein n=1 Tax=Penicillium angulare TaxID=116970 RepID=A0A9W9KHI9_9EURO|nr:hypothetical protein N7456_003400 [Penicillium angulare]
MAEGLADEGNLPGPRISRVYGEWAKGGWGALLTDTCQENGTPAIAQICHSGRQSPRGAGERGLFGKTIAPSAVPLNIGNGFIATFIRDLVFGTPKAMSQSDIDCVITQFVDCARILAQCGFSGIEIHAAHGYLLSQFLSPRINTRQDSYGGSAERRARIVIEIINRIRSTVPKTFCVGIKLNSADHDTTNFEDTMAQIRLFHATGVDFLEISGGTYEDPAMMGRGLREEVSNAKSQSTESREAFFLDFAKEARKRFPELILLLTGGFRTRRGIETVLKDGVCDLVCIGRPAVLRPNFPLLIMDETYSEQEAKVVFSKVPVPFLARLLKMRMLGGGAETKYFREQIHRIAAGNIPQAP